MSSKRPRRRRVIVEGFQARFVVVQLLSLAIGLLVFAALLFGPLVNDLLSRDAAATAGVADLFLHLHRALWPLLLGLFASLAAVFVLMSHRVAGPIYRFRHAFREVAKGRLDVRVQTRTRDYLQPEAAELDAMIRSLGDRIGTAQARVRILQQRLAAVSTSPLSVADIDDLRQTAVLLRQDLDGFVVTPRTGESPPSAAVPTRATGPSGDPSDAGFSLIELLIVATIIGLLAALAMPAYTSALETARTTKAIGDIRAVDREVAVHLVQRGCYPSSLADLGRDTLRDPWGRPYVYGVVARQGGGGKNGDSCPACNGGCINQGTARKDRYLKPLNFDFDLYSLGKDGKSSPPMTAKASEDDVLRANSGGYIGLGRNY